MYEEELLTKLNAKKKILLAGGDIQQETRRYNEATGKTELMRIKGGADDYRFINDPDLPEIISMKTGKRVLMQKFQNFQMRVKNAI